MPTTLVDQINNDEILAKRAEQTMSGVNIDDKFGHVSGLQANEGETIPDNADLNSFTVPGNYFITSAASMVTLSNTPYAQMALSDSTMTGASQLTVFNLTGSSRVTQMLVTPYSTAPDSGNAFGVWYRHSANNTTWGKWYRPLNSVGKLISSTTPGMYVTYHNKNNWFQVKLRHISSGSACEGIILSLSGETGGTVKLLFGVDSNGGFGTNLPKLEIPLSQYKSTTISPFFTLAKYYYDATNKEYYFWLKTDQTHRIFGWVESINYGNYEITDLSTEPSLIASATDISMGVANAHVPTAGTAVGSPTVPTYVDENGTIRPSTTSVGSAGTPVYLSSGNVTASPHYGYINLNRENYAIRIKITGSTNYSSFKYRTSISKDYVEGIITFSSNSGSISSISYNVDTSSSSISKNLIPDVYINQTDKSALYLIWGEHTNWKRVLWNVAFDNVGGTCTVDMVQEPTDLASYNKYEPRVKDTSYVSQCGFDPNNTFNFFITPYYCYTPCYTDPWCGRCVDASAAHVINFTSFVINKPYVIMLGIFDSLSIKNNLGCSVQIMYDTENNYKVSPGTTYEVAGCSSGGGSGASCQQKMLHIVRINDNQMYIISNESSWG